jgi:hypothetical protein
MPASVFEQILLGLTRIRTLVIQRMHFYRVVLRHAGCDTLFPESCLFVVERGRKAIYFVIIVFSAILFLNISSSSEIAPRSFGIGFTSVRSKVAEGSPKSSNCTSSQSYEMDSGFPGNDGYRVPCGGITVFIFRLGYICICVYCFLHDLVYYRPSNSCHAAKIFAKTGRNDRRRSASHK